MFVNLIVLLIRFDRICCSWIGLLMWYGVRLDVIFVVRYRFFFEVSGWKDVIMLCNSVIRLKGIELMDILFVLICDRFSILLRICSNVVDDELMIFSCLCWRLGSGVCFISLRFLSIVFSGVWILWFIVVRNIDFDLFVWFVVCWVLMSEYLVCLCVVMLMIVYSNVFMFW